MSRARLLVWATKMRSFQRALDVHGANRHAVARVAGSILDLAEELERAAEKPKHKPVHDTCGCAVLYGRTVHLPTCAAGLGAAR